MNPPQPIPDATAARGWLHSVGGAAVWTLAQHLSFFACAWWVSWWAGAERFGAFGQGLALSAMLAAAVTFRLEYAGQLERRERRAAALFSLAGAGAAVCTAVLLIVLALSRQWTDVPAWLWAGACALLPQSGVLVLAARVARRGNVVKAAALRSLPALLMVLLLVLAWMIGRESWIEWTIPLAAWLGWLAAFWGSRSRHVAAVRQPAAARVARFHLRFVRAELPGFLLNAAANHGQVLLIGMLAGDALAGTAALGLRIAMLPTSVFGLALADRLRARVVALGRTRELPALVRLAIKRMTGLSLMVHAIGAIAVPWVLPWLFPAQGPVLVTMVLLLLPLGAIRLVASPLAFTLPWRGWLGWSLIGQCLLFACALLSVVLGLPVAGLGGVAAAYAISASLVYLAYLLASLKAIRMDT
ncbi:polysaccharide biosynthesis protein [Diaphorobacter aerolatus]|uniref:Oligosaccharide flippase family protein n=1 Tax=Diaphorobacter aerolatus TaxID=1288495 RepID=A0A7H0GI79_9BURK|nr:hypothetical protein [Diaphorobacter aerolatus]QNP47995.1 hypothetical protein H9K75_18095 [Diaphorobacter aerolatus]